MYLFDIDILIDYIRSYQPALDFFSQLPTSKRTVAFLTQFELLNGCFHKEDEKIANHLLKQFKILPITQQICKTVLQLFRTKRWQIHLGIPDSFIAATAIANKLTLVTRNIKHYQGLSALKIEKPY